MFIVMTLLIVFRATMECPDLSATGVHVITPWIKCYGCKTEHATKTEFCKEQQAFGRCLHEEVG